MSTALKRHETVLEEAVANNGGAFLKARGEGDSTFSVFRRSSDGVRAAVVAQRELGSWEWPDGSRARVRIAIHTGEVVERDGDYFGPAVNRAARIRALAGGGQILLSQSAAELVVDHLDEDMSIVSIGEHPLPGLRRAERVYVIRAEGVSGPERLPDLECSEGSQVAGGGAVVRAGEPSILIVDDHPLWRQTVKSLIERSMPSSPTFEAADGEDAVEQVRRRKPDVVLMDMAIPRLHGIDATKAITESSPATRVLVLSSSEDEEQVMQAVEAGASGYLLKTAGPNEILDGVRRVHVGELVFPPSLAAVVLGELRGSRRRETTGPLASLTEREADVLALMAEGHTNETVAKELHLSNKTVEAHVTAIFSKLGLDPRAGGHRRVLAVVTYLNAANKRKNPPPTEG